MSQAERLQGLKGPAAAVATPPSTKSKSGSSNKKNSLKDASLVSGLSYNTLQQKQRLDRCEWPDRLLYATRMLFGGNQVNGFMKATSAAQRIKKQRARQVGITKKVAAASATDPATEAKEKKTGWDQEEEEKLKKEVMNPRTVKKLKAEMESSLQFCSQIHNLLRGVIMDVDKSQIPHLPPYLPPFATTPGVSPPPTRPSSTKTASALETSSTMPWAVRNDASSAMSKAKGELKITSSSGNEEGSTLRKLRKKKLRSNLEPQPAIPETDPSGRRLVNKKEHNIRLFEVLRFRALRVGDFVAARTTSRDLWILARVLKDYPGIDNKMPPLEFLQLSSSRREAMFREKVQIKDVEGDGHTFQVARSLVLPLPRTYSEAADWGSRIKKGMRCYSMYPQTTSLYPATVFDSTTYCRGDDDIIVVDFDGEEPDEAGGIPKYHIPARFVTLIPREFPSSQPPPASSKKRKSIGGDSSSPEGNLKQQKNDDFLNFDFEGNFDALDMDFDIGEGGDDFASLL